MSDKMRGLSFSDLCRHILDSRERIFGIPEQLYYKADERFQTNFFGRTLYSPLGVAAGPHTQLAQNIISAYLCGARYIELKTVQVLDKLELSKPCIDMEDEGFNCEWSQELSLTESFHEYCNAWILCNYLDTIGRDEVNSKNSPAAGPGFMFNFSIGYNLEGILSEKMQNFLDRISNAKAYISEKIKSVHSFFPSLGEINIDSCISGCVTLSTMHGCPPDEIEKIGMYLIKEKKLDTIIKLNPTLVGQKDIKEILNKNNKYSVEVPSIAFKHDITMTQAKKIVSNLKTAASENGVHFAVKLSNTLESKNNKNIFAKSEKTVYMSGRPLHPVTVNAALRLQKEFEGSLDITFSGGADAWNISNLAECALVPVTVCSDILRPGGYARLGQYLSEIANWMKSKDLNRLSDYFSVMKNNEKLSYLETYCSNLAADPYYQKNTFTSKSIKINRSLPQFDCAIAPCSFSCPTNQEVPLYIKSIKNGKNREALEIIYKDNPFPYTTGTVCDHVCQYKCTRQNIDYSLEIRKLKLYAAQSAKAIPIPPVNNNGKKAAIIGAGPSGLSCAWFLRLAGWEVTVYESAKAAGGLVKRVIPQFRLNNALLEKDIKRIETAGVDIHYNSRINDESFKKLVSVSDAVYIAAGAEYDRKIGIEGEDLPNVIGALDFLEQVKKEELKKISGRVCVIGGGNSAMDAARAALRLTEGEVHLVYRRTIGQMPADREELQAVIAENVHIHELLSPLKIEKNSNGFESLVLSCQKMKLGKVDKSGRRRPLPVNGKNEAIKCNYVISAIGQNSDLSFLNKTEPDSVADPAGMGKIFYGGDCLRGPSSIIWAVADGKQAALLISGQDIHDSQQQYEHKQNLKSNYGKHFAQMAARDFTFARQELARNVTGNMSSVLNKNSIDKSKYAVSKPFSKEEAINEAARCLDCSDVCNVCVSVCPNRALVAIENKRQSIPVFSYDSIKRKFTKSKDLYFRQKFQILRIADFCNECGNCLTFCPSADAPFKEKPSICLDEQSFIAEENALYIRENEIRFKKQNESGILWKEGKRYIYTDGKLTAVFSEKDFYLTEIDGSESYTVLQQASELRLMVMLLKEARIPGLKIQGF